MRAKPMRLGPFIEQNHERILCEWVEFARSLLPWARDLNDETLRDHGDALLHAVVVDLQETQSIAERS